MSVLSTRALNRTLLRRQLLLDRSPCSAPQAIHQLVALQAQEPNCPHVGLWCRLRDFRQADLDALYGDRSVVRGVMLRRTQHLASGDDFRWLRPSIQPIVDSALKTPYYQREIEGLDLDKVAAAGRRLLKDRTLTRREFGRLMAAEFPGRHGGRLAATVEIKEALVHPPPTGLWGAWGNRPEISVALAEEWLQAPMAEGPQPRQLILRYLAAFGPATVADLQVWAGITKLLPVVKDLRPQLTTFRDEQGRELFDVPDAPLASADEPAPVRFLPAFDNVALSHKDRTRIMSEEDRRRIAPEASYGVPLFLVDGFVHGRWALDRGKLVVSPFRPLSKSERAAVREEGEQLLRFIAAGGTGSDDPDVVFAPDGD
ncbi:winged helix DNA-binding domain-containing protein [Streptomyces sp. NPDC060006]|uniref:winged helix DNA-binding domain-containing protein n=1 Tax=unclassified Streptomyces TaxID=2593676 RepID=UPI0036C7860F